MLSQKHCRISQTEAEDRVNFNVDRKALSTASLQSGRQKPIGVSAFQPIGGKPSKNRGVLAGSVPSTFRLCYAQLTVRSAARILRLNVACCCCCCGQQQNERPKCVERGELPRENGQRRIVRLPRWTTANASTSNILSILLCIHLERKMEKRPCWNTRYPKRRPMSFCKTAAFNGCLLRCGMLERNIETSMIRTYHYLRLR